MPQAHGGFVYVSYICVRPGLTGRGLGSALLRAMLAWADAEGRWAYLEGTTPDNQRMYRRCACPAVQTSAVHCVRAVMLCAGLAGCLLLACQ